MMPGRSSGCRCRPGFTITTEACREYLAGGWPDGLDDEIRAADGAASRRRSGAGSATPRTRCWCQRPVRRPAVDARDDGHDPQPRAQRRRPRPGSPRRPATRRSRADCHDRFRAMFRDVVGVEAVPDGPVGAAARARSRPCSAPGTATAPAPTARPRASATTLGHRRSRSRRWCSATAAPTRGRASLFTRNPATGEPVLYGDVLFDAQGEDVVAGTHGPSRCACLDDAAAGGRARSCGGTRDVLEHHYRDCCDIEFTIERGRLWMLQVRVGKRTPAGGAPDGRRDGGGPRRSR